MSSEVPVPRTAVPLGITDPVEKARAELKATLAAIEVKANVPRRIERAGDRCLRDAREFNRRNPLATSGIIVAGAAAVGSLVWSVIRAYTR